MKKILKTVFKVVHISILVVIILCISSIIYNKIKHPESPFTIFNYQLYVDVTNSMVPNLNVNDIIVVKRCCEKDIEVGDIVTFREKDSTITHRIVEVVSDNGKNKYKTKGDNNKSEDDRLITYEEIEGVFVHKIPYLGFFITDKVSFILLIFLILLLTYFPYHKLNFVKKEEIEILE